jgi:glycine/D-amino acid oxidase-like deaminating enzyme
MNMNLQDAEIVVIGAGVIGCAVAYALAKAGKTDVLVVDKGLIGGATTAYGAGLIGQVRPSVDDTQLTMRLMVVLDELRSAGFDPGWHPIGSLRVALTTERSLEFTRLIDVAKRSGLHAESISPAAAMQMYGGLNLEKAVGILHCPTDGYVDPVKLTLALASAAQAHGVRFATGVTVYDILTKADRVTRVETDCGVVACQTVVNASGFFAARLSGKVSVRQPAIPIRHESVTLSDAIDKDQTIPVLRFPDLHAFARPDGSEGDLMVGTFEQSPLSFDPRSLYDPASEPHILANWAALEETVHTLQPFIPGLERAHFKALRKGLPTVTPDGRFLIGSVPGIEGFIMAAGCNVHGISACAGIAAHVVEAVINHHNAPEYAPSRFVSREWSWESARRAGEKTYSNYYGVRE